MSAEQPANPDRPWGLVIALVLGGILLTGVRLATLSSSIEVHGFTHDSAYIARLAENLLMCKGYVNDALWLVFLLPDRLPMPFHNANPLYPTLIAGGAWLTGLDVIRMGFAINIVVHSLLPVGLILVLRPWVPSLGLRAIPAVGVSLFPAIFAESLYYLPDMLCLAFLLGAVACLVRCEHPWAQAISAGVFFGLAWLTRSSAVVFLPWIGVYLLGRFGWKAGLARCAILGLAAGVVASPWLWHTYRVWRNPLRSDSAYYWLQDYHARRYGNEVEYYWHAPEAPPSLGTLLTQEPGAFLTFYAKGIPSAAYNALAKWAEGDRWGAGMLVLLFLGLCGQTAITLKQGRLRPEAALPVLASVTYAVIAVLVFAPRARSLELRYLAPLSLLLALGLLLSWLVSIRDRNAPSRAVRWMNRGLAGLGVLCWLVWVPVQDYSQFRSLTQPDPERTAYVQQIRDLHDQLSPSDRADPLVVGFAPYLVPLVTGMPALSVPTGDDAVLLRFMSRYQARYVVFTRPERDFWRPRWQTEIPEGLVRRADLSTDRIDVYERKEGP